MCAEQNPPGRLVQHCVNSSEFSACSLRQHCVVVSQRCYRIASFLRLVLTQIPGTDIHCHLCNVVLGNGYYSQSKCALTAHLRPNKVDF